MLTSLDWLVIAFMGLAVLTLLSLCLMFLLKNKKAKRILTYVVAVLALYMASVGLRIGLGGWFVTQVALGVVTVLMSIGAVVLERLSKGNDKMLRISRIVAAAALVVGFANALLI
jgi:hypothetical protein